jgi:hypothetical protein
MLQLVRRDPLHPSQRPNTVVRPYTPRENFLATALLSLLSVNVFMLSSVLSFCLFAFWYPQ